MENRKKIKRYKMGLYKNYEKSYEYNVSPRTSTIWETLAIARHCNTEDNTGVHEDIRNTACTKDNCNNTAEKLGDCSGRSNNVANNITMQYSPCMAKTTRNEEDNDDTINSNNKFNSSDMGCINDENEIYNEESMDNRITDDCDDNESETRKKAAGDDEDSYTTGSDVDDNYECIEEQSEEDDITFDDIVLFSESNLTIRDIMTLVVAFSLRFKLSDVGKSALINMIKLLAGPKSEKINISKYILGKAFDPPDDKVVYHYFCDKCHTKIMYSTSRNNFIKQSVTCDSCREKHVISLTSNNYFMSIDVRYQLEMLFSHEATKAEIFDFISSKSNCHANNFNIITDIYDSEIYRNISKDVNLILTFNYSTDGAPLTKSGKRGFWPLQIILNCLPPKSRFKYVLLAGLLMCTHEPNSKLLDLYFLKFNDQVSYLYNNGITVRGPDNKKILMKFCPLACSVDSVCRPIMQNRVQFNGRYGCSWCYHPGEYIAEIHGIRYPIREHDPPLRTADSHHKNVQLVRDLKKSSEMGVRGDISVSQIPQIDMVWSFAYEYMHGILCGVSKYIWNQWTASDSKSCFKLNKAERDTINKRLSLIKPTQNIHRLPESLHDRAKWKASAEKSWLLYYSLPCLNGVLNQDAFTHYSLLVNSLYVLLKTEITANELKQCEYDLLKFVGYFEVYYGRQKMTFNVHTLLHIVQSVKKTGPLWSTSTFPFESNIYKLKQCMNGPNRIDQQMSKKSLEILHFLTDNVDYCDVSAVRDYCTNLFQYKYLSKSYTYDDNNVVFIGKCYRVKCDDKMYKAYKKCIVRGVVFHSQKYRKARRTNDTMIQLHSGEYGQIIHIILLNNKCHIQISKITISSNKPFNVSYMDRIELEDYVHSSIVPISDVKSKVIHIDVGYCRYLCKPPNIFEIQ